jgi:hypothetical protein
MQPESKPTLSLLGPPVALRQRRPPSHPSGDGVLLVEACRFQVGVLDLVPCPASLKLGRGLGRCLTPAASELGKSENPEIETPSPAAPSPSSLFLKQRTAQRWNLPKLETRQSTELTYRTPY